MKLDEKIWDISKWRFLQSEASNWLFSNKLYEIALIFGLFTWAYFEFLSSSNYSNIKYLGLLLAGSAFIVISGLEIGMSDSWHRCHSPFGRLRRPNLFQTNL